MKPNDPTHVPGIMSPVPIEVDHPTPRTDMEVFRLEDGDGEAVMADFARELELELADALVKNKLWVEYLAIVEEQTKKVDHKPCANNLSHVWQQWASYGQPLRKCKWCNMLEAHGTGGWSEVP